MVERVFTHGVAYIYYKDRTRKKVYFDPRTTRAITIPAHLDLGGNKVEAVSYRIETAALNIATGWNPLKGMYAKKPLKTLGLALKPKKVGVILFEEGDPNPLTTIRVYKAADYKAATPHTVRAIAEYHHYTDWISSLLKRPAAAKRWMIILIIAVVMAIVAFFVLQGA